MSLFSPNNTVLLPLLVKYFSDETRAECVYRFADDDGDVFPLLPPPVLSDSLMKLDPEATLIDMEDDSTPTAMSGVPTH